MNGDKTHPNPGTISVALCTFNGAHYLERQLQSMTSQVRLPDELVVCDDGSSDNTLEILRIFAENALFDVRLFVNDSRLGPAKNFEKAIGLCRGEFIALSDQDDIWESQKLDKLATALISDPECGGVFSDAHIIDGTSVPTGKRLWGQLGFVNPPKVRCRGNWTRVLLRQNVVTGATMMIRSRVVETVLPIPTTWMHDGWIAWMLVLYSKLCVVSEPLIKYRVHVEQHASIRPGSFARRVQLSVRQPGGETLLTRIRQFESLLSRIERVQVENVDELRKHINLAVAHLQFRLQLPRGLLRRIPEVLFHWRGYRKYSEGLVTVARDVMFPRNHRPYSRSGID